MSNIWQNLRAREEPIKVLAPMEDVTDHPFRLLISGLGAPDLFFTEFMSVEGYKSSVGRSRVSRRLLKNDQDSPIIAQIWGLDPEAFYITALDLAKMGFDGIDVNLGCPVKKIIKQGSCSAMIGDHQRVGDIVSAIKAGAPHLPLSIKTRIGINGYSLQDWICFLPTLPIDALILHLRTQKELSAAPAHWEYMPEIVSAIKSINPDLIVIGNGDISSVAHLCQLSQHNGMDGGMIGRAVLNNPLLFSNHPERWSSYSAHDRLELLIRHVELYCQVYGDKVEGDSWNQLKRFFKIYINDFEYAVSWRAQFMQTNNRGELESLLKKLKLHV